MSRSDSASTEHRSALPEGTRLHNYSLMRVLGAGGFGITYMAREEVTERAVAIKEYLPSSLAVRERDGMTVQPVSETTRSDYEWGLTRFRQEANLLVRLRHPNIVPSLNYFEANGTAYLVMEYQEGKTLSEVMAGAVQLEESEVRDFLEPLLDGVEAVHKAGLLHRDIKPDNIFIRNDGTPVLIDFGSARQSLGHHSQSMTAVVTDGYAPFEQYERGGDQGPWTDIYAIGAVLFRSLVGHRPPTSTKRLSAQYKGAPDPAAQGFATLRQRVSKQLARAVEGALMVGAEDRPQSIADFRALLADTGARATLRRAEMANPTLLAGTTEARSYAAGQSHLTISAAAPVKRRRALPIYAGLAVLLLAGGAAATYLGVGGIDIPGYTLNSPSAEAKRKQEETKRADAERRKAEEQKRLAAAEEEEIKRRAEDEKRKLDDEAKRRRAEEEAKRADEARRKADEESKRRADEESKRRADEEAKRRGDDDDAKRRAERRAEDEAKRRRAEDEAHRRADEEAKRKDEEARRKDEETKRKEAEDEARRRADEERTKAAGARPSWYVAERNRGSLFFGHKSAQLEPSAFAALERLIADARATPNYRITLVASAERGEGAGTEAARLRAARLEAVRDWLISRGIAADRIRIVQRGGQAAGAEQRYVAVALEGEAAADRPGGERPGADRPGADRPGADRPGQSGPERRYSQAELTQIMYRLLKGAAMSTNIKSEGEQALSSGSDVTALAVCVNWAATTPENAVLGGAYMWSARSGANLHERALRGCQNMSRPNCECVVIDVGGSALRLPPSFVQKYARQ